MVSRFNHLASDTHEIEVQTDQTEMGQRLRKEMTGIESEAEIDTMANLEVNFEN